MTDTDIPDIYNGKPTKYHLFDGFVQSGTGTKVLYIAGIFFSFFTIPIAIELIQAAHAKKNADLARVAVENERQFQQPPSPNRGELYEDNTPESNMFRERASQQPTTRHR